jgi:hypothetical protein
MRNASFAFVGIAVLAAIGCQRSTSTIRLRGTQLETLGPVNLCEGLPPLAVSPDGRYFAAARPLSKDRAVVEIREYDTHALKLSWECKSNDDLVPVMFDRSGKHVLLLSGGDSRSLYSLDLATGLRTELPLSPVSLDGVYLGECNFDRSILSLNTSSGPTTGPAYSLWSLRSVLQKKHNVARSTQANSACKSLILTSSGKVFQVAGDVLYDVYGDAWFRDGAGWCKVDREGRRTTERARPRYLVRDQTHERGSMRLVDEDTELEHRGAEAYIKTVWLEDSRGIGCKAALVCSLPDIWAYGLVPGRRAVYAVTAAGSYIVPYTITKKGAATASE